VRGWTVFTTLNQPIQIPLAILLYIHCLVIITEVFLTGEAVSRQHKQQQSSASLSAGRQRQVISISTLKENIGSPNTPISRISPVNHRNRNEKRDISLSPDFFHRKTHKTMRIANSLCSIRANLYKSYQQTAEEVQKKNAL